MPLSWNEIRQRAITFSRNWADPARASRERAESQTFWNEFFHVFGKSRRAVASFEEPVRNLTGNTDFIDLFWNLHKHIRRFAFIAGYETQTLDPEDPANEKAAQLLANVHDRLEDAGYAGHTLQRFMVRILFCLFAEDTGIFEPNAFTDIITHHTREDGSGVAPRFNALFFHVNGDHFVHCWSRVAHCMEGKA